jgi:hypothetical protein
MNRRRFLAACGACAATRGFARGEDSTTLMPLISGPPVGKEVPSFFLRAITGPQMNRSVCFVCRNGDRPVVMVVLRRLESGAALVLKSLDQLVDRRRADGLRAFGVMLSDEPGKVAPHLQTISFDQQLSLPLGVGPETLADRDSLRIDPAASVTLIAYRERKVVWSSGLRSSDLRDEEIRKSRLNDLMMHVETMLAGKDARS